MKTFIYTLLFTIVSLSSKSQAVATAGIYATIVPFVETKLSNNMEFGDFNVNSNGGTIELGNDNCTTGGVFYTSAKELNTKATTLKITNNNYIHSITLQNDDVVVKKIGGHETMNAKLSMTQLSKIDRGYEVITVSAKLKVGGNQSIGRYESMDPYLVTVNYN